MALIIKIETASELRNAFEAYNRDNYSYEAYQAILDLYEDTDAELDVIEICCNYNEMDKEDIIREYDLLSEFDCEEIDDIHESDVLDYLNDKTYAIELSNGNFFYQVF